MKFRELRAEEIDARIGTISEKGCSLLLYKDARVDQNLLDEEVGSENWQRKHEVIGGNLYCSVGVFIESRNEWVWKQDVGTESNTEKEKGQASDSFKRACVNWGIGRELYTAPFIWINSNNVKLEKNEKGKWITKEHFFVKNISYKDGNISDLEIVNSNGVPVFSTKQNVSAKKETTEKKDNQEKKESHAKEESVKEDLPEESDLKKIENMKIADIKVKSLQEKCKNDGVPVEKILKAYKLDSLADMTEKKFSNCITNWEKVKAL